MADLEVPGRKELYTVEIVKRDQIIMSRTVEKASDAFLHPHEKAIFDPNNPLEMICRSMQFYVISEALNNDGECAVRVRRSS